MSILQEINKEIESTRNLELLYVLLQEKHRIQHDIVQTIKQNIPELKDLDYSKIRLGINLVMFYEKDGKEIAGQRIAIPTISFKPMFNWFPEPTKIRNKVIYFQKIICHIPIIDMINAEDFDVSQIKIPKIFNEKYHSKYGIKRTVKINYL